VTVELVWSGRLNGISRFAAHLAKAHEQIHYRVFVSRKGTCGSVGLFKLLEQNCFRLVLINKIHRSKCSVVDTTGKQAVVVMACENLHMDLDMIIEPGLVMIFAHGVE
jgi:USP8 interacting